MAQLCQRQEELRQLKTRVLLISFGTLPAIQQWLRETCPDFQVLLDRERNVYRAYGLERSFWRSHSPRTLWRYAQLRLAGHKKSDTHGDDTSQLGGDFIVDTGGILRFVHASHEPVDRPTVAALLAALRKRDK